MNRSTNFNFYLPENSDYRDVSQLTYNFDTIDTQLAATNGRQTGISAGTLTAGEKFTISDSFCYKLGHIVIVAMTATATETYSTTDTIATIPSGYRPSSNVSAATTTLTRSSTTYHYTSHIYCKTGGTITEDFTSSGQTGDKITALAIYNTI